MTVRGSGQSGSTADRASYPRWFPSTTVVPAESNPSAEVRLESRSYRITVDDGRESFFALSIEDAANEDAWLMHTVIYDLAMGLFAPIFFVTVGFDITFGVFSDSLGILVVLVAIAFLGKIVGSWLFSLPTSLTSREGLVVGFGMNGRGTVEIIIATVALEAGVIDTEMFSILVFIAIFTTALVPVTVTWGVRLLERADELVYVDADAASSD